jgi:hypothetical protein
MISKSQFSILANSPSLGAIGLKEYLENFKVKVVLKALKDKQRL